MFITVLAFPRRLWPYTYQLWMFRAADVGRIIAKRVTRVKNGAFMFLE